MIEAGFNRLPPPGRLITGTRRSGTKNYGSLQEITCTFCALELLIYPVSLIKADQKNVLPGLAFDFAGYYRIVGNR